MQGPQQCFNLLFLFFYCLIAHRLLLFWLLSFWLLSFFLLFRSPGQNVCTFHHVSNMLSNNVLQAQRKLDNDPQKGAPTRAPSVVTIRTIIPIITRMTIALSKQLNHTNDTTMDNTNDNTIDNAQINNNDNYNSLKTRTLTLIKL